MKPLHVGLLDSGAGGLSVLAACRQHAPDFSYFYCGDHANFPYGTKNDADLVSIVCKTSQKFVQRADLDILIVACNTASTVALEPLRKLLLCPVIGVVPAIKPAAAMSNSKSIGILATAAAVRQTYLQKLSAEYASNCRVYLQGSAVLVQEAERKLNGEIIDQNAVNAEVSKLLSLDKNIDTVVLGCTHFPLIIDELRLATSGPVNWVHSGDAVARRLLTVASGFENAKVQSEQPTLFYSTDSSAVLYRPDALAGFGIMSPCERL